MRHLKKISHLQRTKLPWLSHKSNWNFKIPQHGLHLRLLFYQIRLRLSSLLFSSKEIVENRTSRDERARKEWGEDKKASSPPPSRFFCPRPTLCALSHLSTFDSRQSPWRKRGDYSQSIIKLDDMRLKAEGVFPWLVEQFKCTLKHEHLKLCHKTSFKSLIQ